MFLYIYMNLSIYSSRFLRVLSLYVRHIPTIVAGKSPGIRSSHVPGGKAPSCGHSCRSFVDEGKESSVPFGTPLRQGRRNL